MLKEKRAQQVNEVAGPHLRPGEQVQLTSYASVGSVSVKRRAATAAVAAVASGGMLAVSVRPRRMYIAMTRDRLLFFNGDTPSGKPGFPVLMDIPRPLITVANAKKGFLTFTVQLAVEGQDEGLKLIFPRPTRDEGEKLAAEIPAAPQPA
ncbi:MAG TPA: hypothetical protein VH089_05140 [Streptosporangiaceae bacterium]|nr:hypothetical protein [Streptosporangiaceae bacterium]